jgi:acyl carrier protein
MDIESFIELFADQFDDVEAGALTPETEFKQVEGWNSLVALSVIAMIDEEYDVTVKGNDITSSVTIQDLYDIVCERM